MGRTRERGRQWERWIDEFEENLKIIGIRSLCTVARDRKEWRNIVLEANGHKGM
jgi:hypothetical protein